MVTVGRRGLIHGQIKRKSDFLQPTSKDQGWNDLNQKELLKHTNQGSEATLGC